MMNTSVPQVLDSVTCVVWSIGTLFMNSSANRGYPRQLVNFSIFFPQTKVVSDISDLNTGDAKQLEDIPVEQAVLLNFSLRQYGSRFLHFTNTASVYSPTFGDRSGF